MSDTGAAATTASAGTHTPATETAHTGAQAVGTPIDTPVNDGTAAAGHAATADTAAHGAQLAAPALTTTPQSVTATTTGAATTASYHGGTVASQVLATNADGSRTLAVTRADGTQVEVHQAQNPAGQKVDSYTDTDGSEVVTTATGTASGHTTIAGTDGSSVVRTWDGTTLHEADTDAAGSTTEVAWNSTMQGTPGQSLFTVKQLDVGGTQVSTTISATADGGAVAVTSDPQGDSATARLTVEDIANVDGSHTRVFGFPDGHAETFTFDTAGTPVAHQSVAPGAHTIPDAGTQEPGVHQTADHPTDPSSLPATADHVVAPDHTGHDAQWAQDLRSAVVDAMNGRPTQAGGEYHNMINGVAQFVATAVKAGPNGLPNAPWADDVAQYLVGALHLDQGAAHSAVPTTGDTGGHAAAADPGTAGLAAATDGAAATHTSTAADLSPTAHATDTATATSAAATPAVAPHTVVSSAADGSRVETTTAANGSTAQVTYRADGSVGTVAKDASTGRTVDTTVATDGSLSRVITLADGSTSTIQQAADGTRSVVADLANGSAVNQHVYADGTWNATLQDATTGHTIQKSLNQSGAVEYTDQAPDGSFVSAERHADGSVVQDVQSSDGSAFHSVVHADGHGETTTTAADGHVVDKTLGTDGTRTETHTDPDGTSQSVSLAPDGTKTEASTTVGGSTVSTVTAPDGTVASTATDATTHHVVVTKQAADGVVTRTDTAPDGTSSTAVQSADRSTIDVTFSDSTRSIHVQDPGTGHAVTTERDPDGQVVVTTAHPDGSSTQVATRADHSTSTAVTSADQATVDVTTVDGTGATTQTVHVTDANTTHAVTTVENADGSSLVTTKHDDGSSTQIATTHDGSTTTTVVTPNPHAGDSPLEFTATLVQTTSDGRTLHGVESGTGDVQWTENDASTQGHTVVTTIAHDGSTTRLDTAPDSSWTKTVTTPNPNASDSPLAWTATMVRTTSDGRTLNGAVDGLGAVNWTENDASTQGHLVETTVNADGSSVRLDTAPDSTWTKTVTTPNPNASDSPLEWAATLVQTTNDGRTLNGALDQHGSIEWTENDAFTQGHDVQTLVHADGSSVRYDVAPDHATSTTTVTPGGVVTKVDTAAGSDQVVQTTTYTPINAGDVVATVQTQIGADRTVNTTMYANGSHSTTENDASTGGNTVSLHTDADGSWNSDVRGPSGNLISSQDSAGNSTVYTTDPKDPTTTLTVTMNPQGDQTIVANYQNGNVVTVHHDGPSNTAQRTVYDHSTGKTTAPQTVAWTGPTVMHTRSFTGGAATTPDAGNDPTVVMSPSGGMVALPTTDTSGVHTAAAAAQSAATAAASTGPGGSVPPLSLGASTAPSVPTPTTLPAANTGGTAFTGLIAAPASDAGAATTLTPVHAVDAARSLPSHLVDDGKAAATHALDDGKTAVTNTLNDGKSAVTGALDDGKSALTNTLNDGKSAVTNALGDPQGALTKVLGSDPQSALTNGVDGLEHAGSGLLQKGTDALGNLENAGNGFLQKGADTLSNAADTAHDVAGSVADAVSHPGDALDRAGDELDQLMTGSDLTDWADDGAHLLGNAVGTHTYSTSFQDSFGLSGSAHGSTTVDGITAAGTVSGEVAGGVGGMATATVSGDSVSAMAAGRAWLGADVAAHGSVTGYDMTLVGNASARFGEEVAGQVVGRAGLTGVDLDGGFSFVAGAHVTADGKADLGVATASVGAGADVGLAASAHGGVDLSTDDIGFHLDGDASLGVGLNAHASGSINPQNVAVEAVTGLGGVDYAAHGVQFVSGVADLVGTNEVKLGDAIQSATHDASNWTDRALSSSVGDVLGSGVGNAVGDVASSALKDAGIVTGDVAKVAGYASEGVSDVVGVVGDGLTDAVKAVDDVGTSIIDDAGKALPWNW